jgi:hypothetical protein
VNGDRPAPSAGPPFEDSVSHQRRRNGDRPEASPSMCSGPFALVQYSSHTMIGRQLRLGSDRVNVLRALGAGPAGHVDRRPHRHLRNLVIGSVLRCRWRPLCHHSRSAPCA